MRSTVALNSLHRLLSCICLVLLFTSMVVATPAQEKPRLKDFGKSLKKDSRKNKEESPDSKKDKGESADVIRVQTDLVVCDVLVVNDRGHAIPGLERGDFVVSEDGNQ